MRIDWEYTKKLLDVFLESDKPTITSKDFSELRCAEGEDKFVFHVNILSDKGVFVGAHADGDMGVSCIMGDYIISDLHPWRLTAVGHDFACALAKSNILNFIKDKLKNEGISAVVDIAKNIASKNLEKLMGDVIA